MKKLFLCVIFGMITVSFSIGNAQTFTKTSDVAVVEKDFSTMSTDSLLFRFLYYGTEGEKLGIEIDTLWAKSSYYSSKMDNLSYDEKFTIGEQYRIRGQEISNQLKEKDSILDHYGEEFGECIVLLKKMMDEKEQKNFDGIIAHPADSLILRIIYYSEQVEENLEKGAKLLSQMSNYSIQERELSSEQQIMIEEQYHLRYQEILNQIEENIDTLNLYDDEFRKCFRLLQQVMSEQEYD